MSKNNKRRARRAARALDSYGVEPEDINEGLIDLLTDLMHFCANRQIDFARRLRTAATHFREETASEVIDG